MLTGLKRKDQVLKTYCSYIAVCSKTVLFIWDYVVVNHHGLHLNGINGSLMSFGLCLNCYQPHKGCKQARRQISLLTSYGGAY